MSRCTGAAIRHGDRCEHFTQAVVEQWSRRMTGLADIQVVTYLAGEQE